MTNTSRVCVVRMALRVKGLLGALKVVSSNQLNVLSCRTGGVLVWCCWIDHSWSCGEPLAAPVHTCFDDSFLSACSTKVWCAKFSLNSKSPTCYWFAIGLSLLHQNTFLCILSDICVWTLIQITEWHSLIIVTFIYKISTFFS